MTDTIIFKESLASELFYEIERKGYKGFDEFEEYTEEPTLGTEAEEADFIPMMEEDEDEENGPLQSREEIDEAEMGDPLAGISVDNLTRLYFKQVASEPLLTREDEVFLAKQIERGQHARIALVKNTYRPEDLPKLRQYITQEGEARERLLKANSRLVISVAKKYMGRNIPFIDLIQEGNIGLMRAAKKFDYTLGLKFSTYATWWIRQAITRAISNNSRTIRIPVQMGEQINKLRQMEMRLTQDLSRSPSDYELSQALDMPPSKIRDLRRISKEPVSIDAPLYDDDDGTYGDIISDIDAPAPDEAAFSNLANEHLYQALTALPPKEAQVLSMRYGLDGGRVYTLAEIGRELGVTRERVRQIENRALKRLRSPKMKYILQKYTE